MEHVQTSAVDEEGWPYPDPVAEFAAADDFDLDLIELHRNPAVFEDLTEAEYEVVSRRYGLGRDSQSMKEICHDMALSHTQTKDILGAGLEKLRNRLRD